MDFPPGDSHVGGLFACLVDRELVFEVFEAGDEFEVGLVGDDHCLGLAAVEDENVLLSDVFEEFEELDLGITGVYEFGRLHASETTAEPDLLSSPNERSCITVDSGVTHARNALNLDPDGAVSKVTSNLMTPLTHRVPRPVTGFG